ncbi:PR domain zinc finger protein 13 [Anopheles darlingi]|uniref:PR domain zinc finger protein 13 n=1 Tax=Anopheles darlingi TaxID=43151 RepID=UPI00210063CA|nr:PR domain zinc finger protein 13 [Anopheles darlingi]
MFPTTAFAGAGGGSSAPFGRKCHSEIDLNLNLSPVPSPDAYEGYVELSSQSASSSGLPVRQASPPVPITVCAVGFLPNDSVSKAYHSEEVCLRGSLSTATAATGSSRLTMIRKSSSTGLLTANESVGGTKGSHWIRSIRLASDVRSFNALLELTASQLLRIRLTTDVANGEELKLWFSEDVIAHMQIPFLTPVNIQRQNCYVCHLCQQSYEYPNPLKIHLATVCNREPVALLWHRLHQALATRYGSPFSPLYDFQPWRNSAFRPVLNPHLVKMDLAVSSPTSHQQHRRQPPGTSADPVADEPTGAQLVTAAHLETIVSNMGSSKQGHVCIYCGKLYSRKYGLKIHIRTHTGFKPLKCQYCLRPFGDPSNLNKHIRLHRQHDGSLYECNLCGKKLARRRDLQRHLQARHNSSGQVIDQSTTSEEDDEDVMDEDDHSGGASGHRGAGRR